MNSVAALMTAPATAGTVGTAAKPLLPAVNYSMRVRGTNLIGVGAWSEEVSYTTDQAGRCGNTDDVIAYKVSSGIWGWKVDAVLVSFRHK
jgi:hypothetical protein